MPPKMWGPTMVGFGEYHYVYASGHEGDIFLTGFSPRKSALTLYFTACLEQRFGAQLKKLGKVKASKACLYIKKLADVDLAVLREMIQASVAQLTAMSKPSKPAPATSSLKNQSPRGPPSALCCPAPLRSTATVTLLMRRLTRPFASLRLHELIEPFCR